MKKRRERFLPIWVGAAIGAICAIAFFVGVLETWSLRASDQFFLPRTADPRIAVVTIDDVSIGRIGRWPWPRSVHAQLIDKLKAAGVIAIGYDVNFPEISDENDDAALETALKNAGNVVLPVELELTQAGNGLTANPNKILAPIPRLSAAAAGTGHSNTPPDPDGIMRRVPLFTSLSKPGDFPSFTAEVARVAGFGDRLGEAPLDGSYRMIVNFPNQPFKAFQSFSAVDVLNGTADLSALKGAIVFVGATAPDLHDALLVPTSNGVLMPGVEIHASVLDTLIGRHWLVPFDPWVFAAILFFLGILMGLLVPRLRARWSIPLTIVLWIAIIVTAFAAFDRGVIVDVVWPTIVLIFGYGAVTLERRISADRERRELKSAFSRYVNASVVDSLLADPAKLKLGGERRAMSVLFSDIRGFTTLSEGLDPERLVDVLNKYLTRMTAIVFQHDGVLDKYIGDAVMAFWNAPLDQPDHAFRAVATAIDMRDALAQMNHDKAFGDLELHIGLGVNSGDMVVGNVGGEARFDYTIIGDNVNLGSRLEGLTKEYGVGIIVSEGTLGLLEGKILTRRLDKVAVKGKKEPVVIYEAVERMEKATEVQRALGKDFETALEKYFKRDFAGAIVACDAILAAHPEDGPSKTLKERSMHFRDTPPPDDWVGTWVMKKK